MSKMKLFMAQIPKNDEKPVSVVVGAIVENTRKGTLS